MHLMAWRKKKKQPESTKITEYTSRTVTSNYKLTFRSSDHEKELPFSDKEKQVSAQLNFDQECPICHRSQVDVYAVPCDVVLAYFDIQNSGPNGSLGKPENMWHIYHICSYCSHVFASYKQLIKKKE